MSSIGNHSPSDDGDVPLPDRTRTVLSCPNQDVLLLCAVAQEPRIDEAITRHVATCSSCQLEVAELRAVVGAVSATSAIARAKPGECLDELALASIAQGGESNAEDLAHLASCGLCRAELTSLIHLLALPAIRGEFRALGPMVPVGGVGAAALRPRSLPPRIWRGGVGILAAAAAAFLLVRIPASDDAGQVTERHRGPTNEAVTAPIPASPVGDVSRARVLQWAAAGDVTRFRVTLFDARGHALLEAETTDTIMLVPDSITLVPNRSYLWKVEARSGFDRWSSSPLVEFRVTGDSAPMSSFDSLPAIIRPVAYTALAPRPGGRDSLRVIAPRLSDSALVVEARARPVELREALASTLVLATQANVAARDRELTTARRLAAAYAAAWGDDFLARDVTRFIAWPPDTRVRRIRADSGRRAGITAFSRDGASAAIVIWRRTLTAFDAIGDTVRMAATLGNIGAALARNGSTDSAEYFLRRSGALATSVGDLRVLANALSEMAGLREAHGDLAGANEHYARAVGLRERIGDTRGLSADYNNLAGLARTAGDLVLARKYLEAALELNQRDGRAEVAATNLVNLAALASLDGDVVRAGTLYRDALATWKAAGRDVDVADAERGLGELELRRGNYSLARRHLVEARGIYRRTGALADELSVRRALASISAAVGDLQTSLDELRSAQQAGDSLRAPPEVRAGIMLARADLMTQLNMRPQAERLYVAAQSLFRAAGDRAGEAEAQQGRGTMLLDRGDLAGAKAMFGAALRTHKSTGSRRAASLTRLLLGELSLTQGDTNAARRQLADGAAELAALGDPVAAAAALGQGAALELAAASPAAAESLYRAALATVHGRIAPDITWRLHAGLGAARRARGATGDAIHELRRAIADIERGGLSLALPERRAAFLIDKWDVYVQLAMLEESRGRVASAFEVSERLRASEMLAVLSMGRIALPGDRTADLAAREQDLRQRIGELTRALEEGTAGSGSDRGPDVSRGNAVTREALLRAQETYIELQLQMRERAPRHSALVSPATSSWRDVARRLAPSEAFVEYLVSDERSLAFVITRDTIMTVDLSMGRPEIAKLVDFTRGTLHPRGSPRLDSLWRAPLRQLHAALIAPVEATGLLANVTRLTVVPYGELHYLPFAALLADTRERRFLVQRYELSVTPSAAVWLALGARTRAPSSSGSLVLAPRPDALPASRDEVAAIARLSGRDTRVLIGTTATEADFRRHAPTRRVIHLATYGVLNKQNPLFSFVELARGTGDDGRLEVHEVFGLDLAADLVVLSACQTGLASGALTDVPPGDDWIGLVRAFLSAGAGEVMASLWPVQDRATADLMQRFYGEYTRGVKPDAALAATQRAMLANPATANPYYWAGFEVVGGR